MQAYTTYGLKTINQIPLNLRSRIRASSLLFVLIFLMGMQSCVQNRKIVLMQKDDLHKKDILLDSALRKYDLAPFEYKLQPNDLIYIDVKSLTAEDFDVFRKINEGAQMMMGGGGALGGVFYKSLAI